MRSQGRGNEVGGRRRRGEKRAKMRLEHNDKMMRLFLKWTEERNKERDMCKTSLSLHY